MWKKVGDQDLIKVGSLFKGYTYSIGDYHNDFIKTPEKYFGNAKLRKGIVLEVFSKEIFLVQFQNSAALKSENKNIRNKISYQFDNFQLNQQGGIIYGTDTYCILLQRKQIKYINSQKSSIVGNFAKLKKTIMAKHSREKNEIIQYIKLEKYRGLPKEKIDNLFEKWQYTKKERYFSHEKSWEKFQILLMRHEKKNCVYHEYQKIKNLFPYLNQLKMNEIEKRQYDKFLRESKKEYQDLKNQFIFKTETQSLKVEMSKEKETKKKI